MSELYTIEELSKLWKVSDDTIRRRIKETPDLEISYLGRLVRISEQEAQKLLRRIKSQRKKK
jgi:excisionase family DNA binding protein